MALTITAAGAALGYSLALFASGFPSSGGSGPEGACGTPDGGVLVACPSSNNLYKFPLATDGQALPTPITARYGMLFNPSGVIYATSDGQQNGLVVTLNNDGTLNSTFANVGATYETRGIGRDPSGNLWVAGATPAADGAIFKVTPAGVVTTLASGFITDGLIVSQDGKTVYVASGNNMVGYDTSTGAQVFSQAIAGVPDGMGGPVPNSTLSGFVVVNTNAGTLIQIQLTAPYTQVVIANGGTRGDHVGYAADGSLYISQSTELYRLVFQNWYLAPVSITDGAANVVAATGLPAQGFSSLALAEAAGAGISQGYCHVGGKPIGVLFPQQSVKYFNSVTRETFRLVGPAPVISLAASSLSIVAGSPVTLTFTTNSANSTIDHGVGGIVAPGGSAVVHPTVTTTYTLTDSTDGFTTISVAVTVVVANVAPANNLAAVSTCAGVSLSWTPPTVYTGFNVYRDGVLIGTTATLTYLDVPPDRWTDHTCTVQTVNGTSSATVQPAVVAQMPGTVGQVTGVVAAPRPGAILVSWSPVAHALTYQLYRGIVPGGETLIASNLAGASVLDAVSSDRPYYYKVAAVGPCGAGALSMEASATALPTTPCAANQTSAEPGCNTETNNPPAPAVQTAVQPTQTSSSAPLPPKTWT